MFKMHEAKTEKTDRRNKCTVVAGDINTPFNR